MKAPQLAAETGLPPGNFAGHGSLPELLAPAGSPEALDAAVGEGADAVYLGLKTFNARLRSSNFAYSQFEGALRVLHRMGRKIYVTVNTVFEERDADRLYQFLKYLANLGPDGIIVQDFGIITLVREHFPSLKLLASTQMNIASARGVNLLSRYGFSRVILARELSLEEIRAIRGRTNMELEVFVHGALCVSASGLCLFSSYLGGKSANRGLCTQACRRFYYADSLPPRRTAESAIGLDRDAKTNGGYYFSPADLQLLDRLPDLVEAGVNSFKIEGRMKSADYVGAVTAAYRRVIDGLAGGGEGKIREALEEGRRILRGDFARTKTIFYFDRGTAPPGASLPDWLNPAQSGGTGIFLGKILRVKGSGEGPETPRRALIPSGTPLPAPGDSVRLHRADDSDRQSHKLSFVSAAEGEGGFWISVPEGFEPGDAVYLIQTRAMSKRYSPVVPSRLESFTRSPGREKAPPPAPPGARKPAGGNGGGKNGHGSEGKNFPAGIYVAVSRLEDLYLVQSVRPVKVILPYGPRLVQRLLEDRPAPLPFAPGEIIIGLDPFFPEGEDASLEEDLGKLRERGYRCFIVNNPGHFSFFRNTPCSLIAGPYLYTFNRWALSFVAGQGVDGFISPLENSRRNLERTVDTGRRSLTFITIFAWPALFRVRADLGEIYDFGDFYDSREEGFRLVSGSGGSRVYPEKPFSIVDKTPFLKEAGFSRFIVDLSGAGAMAPGSNMPGHNAPGHNAPGANAPLKKAAYKNIMNGVQNAVPLPGTVRFNWKDGFYQDQGTAAGKNGADRA